MNYSKDMARRVCEQLGVEWDETALAPTLCGEVITSDMVDVLFSATSVAWDGTLGPYSHDILEADVADCIFAESAIVINSVSPLRDTYDGANKAPLAA